MHTHGIEVLNAAHDHAVVRHVAHDFQLELLPTRDGFLDEDLANGRRDDALRSEVEKVILIVRDPGAGSSEDKARSDDDGPTDLFRDVERGLDVVSETRLGNLESNVAHRFFEQFAILRGRDRLGTCADHFHT